MSLTAVAASIHPTWALGRASGIVAWALATVAVLLGVAQSGRLSEQRARHRWVTAMHPWVSALAVLATATHLGALVADPWLHLSAVELAVPFAAEFKPDALAAGVVATWLLVAVEATSLARKWMPKKAWRAVHLSAYVSWAAATGHMVTAGTDRTNPVLVAATVVAVCAVTFATTYRITGPRRAAARARAAAIGAARTGTASTRSGR